jgi:hypothetical protein
MTTAESERRAPLALARAADRHPRRESAVRRISGAARGARAGATLLMARVPGAMHATGVGAQDTTSALQALPDSTLRWLTAGSVGLGAGLCLAGAPRVVAAAGVAPALFAAAAMVLRPTRSRAAVTTAPLDALKGDRHGQ